MLRGMRLRDRCRRLCTRLCVNRLLVRLMRLRLLEDGLFRSNG